MDRSSAITVSQLTHHIKSALENAFPPLWVEGEVSGFRRAASGHCYFTLKDSESQVSAVMFRREASMLPFEPEDGMQVLVHGRISVYEARGQYQVIIDDMEPRGTGALREALERLRMKLSDEGLFDDDRKKAMPSLVRTVGIVTSPTGAAVRDILRVLADAEVNVDVIIAPAVVQGTAARESIMAGMELLAERKEVDLVMIGRGGGSFEDLMPFSHESVVRAVATYPKPLISAVGHETDVALSDLAADMRAPTPTAAAQMVVAAREDASQQLVWAAEKMQDQLRWKIEESRQSLRLLSARLVHPSYLIEQGRIRLDDLAFRLSAHMGDKLRTISSELRRMGEMLRTLGPQSILDRGYAVVMKSDGRIIRDNTDVEMGEGLDVRLSSGSIGVKVTRK
jgi:exodeoxyribonuclease VII large subunit